MPRCGRGGINRPNRCCLDAALPVPLTGLQPDAMSLVAMSGRRNRSSATQPGGLTFASGNGLVLISANRKPQKKSDTDGKRLRNLRAALCDDVAAHPPFEFPGARPARHHGAGPRLFRLADP